MDGTNMAERPRHLTGKKTWPVGWWSEDESHHQLTEPKPTDSLPGTVERMCVYALRLIRRQEMFHDDDAELVGERKPELSVRLEMPEDWFMSEEEEA